MNAVDKNEHVVKIESLPEGYIKNPQTGKLIKINGRSYNKMLRDGIIEKAPQHDEIPKEKTPYKRKTVVAEETSYNKAVAKKRELESTNPPPSGKQYAISNNKKQVLLRDKKGKTIKPSDMADKMSSALTNVYSKLHGQYGDCEEFDDKTKRLFKQMLLQELAGVNKTYNDVVQSDSDNDSDSDSDLDSNSDSD